jgi:glycosyltransferase involved in cell wall biosynthesis
VAAHREHSRRSPCGHRERSVRVLYVERTGLVGGGERSLLGLLEALPGDVEPRLACPAGPLEDQAARRGVRTATIAESVGSLKLHPVHTPVALGAMAAAAAGLRRTARRWRPDVLHANSIRAGMIAGPVARLLDLPMVLHVRDRLPPSVITERIQGALAARASAVIAISDYVADAFDPDGRARCLRVIDNPFDLERLDPRRFDRADARAAIGVRNGAPVLALIGQITPWKGQEEAVRALAIVRRAHPDALLLLVGEAKFTARATRYDNHAYLDRLRATIAGLGLVDAVSFLGEREDVPELLRACDLALVPSWEEPFGRTVVEAMAMEVPVLATAVGGPSEIVHDEQEGVLLPPRQPEAWAAAIVRLLDDDAQRRSMGIAARKAALTRFRKARHASQVVALYREVIATAGR